MDPRDSVSVAARLMVDKKISALPVVKERKLVGIVTESDLLKALISDESRLRRHVENLGARECLVI